MKLKLFTLILCAIICANTYIGAKDISKSAQSSICKITVFQADGKQLSGYGFSMKRVEKSYLPTTCLNTLNKL